VNGVRPENHHNPGKPSQRDRDLRGRAESFARVHARLEPKPVSSAISWLLRSLPDTGTTAILLLLGVSCLFAAQRRLGHAQS
jgi:hypothetical protein